MAPSSSAAIGYPHTSRAQRARGRCAIVHLKPRAQRARRFAKKLTGFVTSRSESSLNLPQHGYRSIVAPWGGASGRRERTAWWWWCAEGMLLGEFPPEPPWGGWVTGRWPKGRVVVPGEAV